jgi:hypothetical protein
MALSRVWTDTPMSIPVPNSGIDMLDDASVVSSTDIHTQIWALKSGLRQSNRRGEVAKGLKGKGKMKTAKEGLYTKEAFDMKTKGTRSL